MTNNDWSQLLLLLKTNVNIGDQWKKAVKEENWMIPDDNNERSSIEESKWLLKTKWTSERILLFYSTILQ